MLCAIFFLFSYFFFLSSVVRLNDVSILSIDAGKPRWGKKRKNWQSIELKFEVFLIHRQGWTTCAILYPSKYDRRAAAIRHGNVNDLFAVDIEGSTYVTAWLQIRTNTKLNSTRTRYTKLKNQIIATPRRHIIHTHTHNSRRPVKLNDEERLAHAKLIFARKYWTLHWMR